MAARSGLSGLASGLRTRVGGEVQTLTCQICWNSYRREQTEDCPAGKEGCGPWCSECVAESLAVKIRDGHVSRADLCCPGSGCKGQLLHIGDEEAGIARLLRPLGPTAAADILAKWRRYQRTQRDDTRECPFCGNLQPGTKAVCDMGDYAPSVRCDACSEDFCFYHSNAHQGRTCAEYLQDPVQKKMEEEEQQLKGTLRPCPTCGRKWQKTRSSCNHMTCPPPCKTNWCWICGEQINPGTHYANLFGTGGSCAGRLFEGTQMEGGDVQAEVIVGPQASALDNPFTTPPQYRWARLLSYIAFLATCVPFTVLLGVFLWVPSWISTVLERKGCKFLGNALAFPLAVAGAVVLPVLFLIPMLMISGTMALLIGILILVTKPLYWLCHQFGRPPPPDSRATTNAMSLYFNQNLFLCFMLFEPQLGEEADDGDEGDPDRAQEVPQGQEGNPF